MPTVGERATDSAGITVEYKYLEDVEPGDTIAEGWQPFLVVERLELTVQAGRMHFKGGHAGGWCERDSLVAVEVTA